jgi:hypothetical protein
MCTRRTGGFSAERLSYGVELLLREVEQQWRFEPIALIVGEEEMPGGYVTASCARR